MADRNSPPSEWPQQHFDLGSLLSSVTQRVVGLENAVSGINESLRDLSKKLDSKPTNWWAIIGGIVGMLGLIGGFLIQAKAPIDADLDRHDREIQRIVETAINRDDYHRDRAGEERWNESLRDRLRTDEDNAVSQRQLEAFTRRLDERYGITSQRDLDAVARLDKERAETEQRLNGRIDALIGSVNQMREQSAKPN